MAKNQFSLKSNDKVSVRKDLFGAHDTCGETDENSPDVNCQSPLKTVWGQGSCTQQTANSLILSPSLKRSPNRYSTSPRPKKSPGTPKSKSSTPRKLSKYSPFRKKVYNANPKDSIKQFFPVKEPSTTGTYEEYSLSQTAPSLGITPFQVAIPSTSNDAMVLSQPFLPLEVIISNGNESEITFNTPKKSTPPKSNASTPRSARKLSPNSKITESNDVYGNFLSRIQLELMMCDGLELFSEEEKDQFNKFNKFDRPSQRLYGRLLNRKINWIRTSSMKYGEVQLQLLLLQQNGFITSDCTSETLDNLLDLLVLKELKTLCKTYKLSEQGTKNEIISRLISRAKQPSIESFFKRSDKSSCSSAEKLLRGKIYELLGEIIKVTSGPYRTFCRCLLFFSYPHFHGLERDRFKDELALVSKARDLTFPSYEIYRTKLFQSREHFLEYESALLESSALLEAKEDKKESEAIEKLRNIIKKLEGYLTSTEKKHEIESLPDFLLKFTAAGCYVRAVSSCVELFKKQEQTLSEAEACLLLLLSQRHFSRHRRGQWYEQLALLYQSKLRDNVKATQTVLQGLRDEYIDIVSRYTLCARALMLEGRKKNGLKDYLKDALAMQRGQIDPLEEPDSITITEQILTGCRPGLKQVYVQDSEDGKMLSSVEEVAREHFRKQGFTHGAHDEGKIIKSLIFSCFWNEIYGETMANGHGLFHSEFQTVPLDWNCETFYERRREKFKSKLQDLAEGGVEAVIQAYQSCYVNNCNKESVVNWQCLADYETAVSLIRCIDLDVFLNLSRLLLRHHKVYGAGFPDLTLWDPLETKCLFVEVKSPNDHLSIKQKVWLHSLKKMGASALVCHVQSVGWKNPKRKANSPAEDV